MAPSCSSFVTSSSRAISIVRASTSSLRSCAITSAASAFSRLNKTTAAFRIPVMKVGVGGQRSGFGIQDSGGGSPRAVSLGYNLLRWRQPPAEHGGSPFGVVFDDRLQLVAFGRLFGKLVFFVVERRGERRGRLSGGL